MRNLDRRQFAAAFAIAALLPAFAIQAMAQTPPISDIEWTVEEIPGIDRLGDKPPTLTIAQDGRASGNGGCNQFFATAASDGDKLVFAEIGSTFMACDEPMMAVEKAYFAALAATTAYRIEAGRLLLLDAQGQTTVALVAAV